jgi:hypothetical protein
MAFAKVESTINKMWRDWEPYIPVLRQANVTLTSLPGLATAPWPDGRYPQYCLIGDLCFCTGALRCTQTVGIGGAINISLPILGPSWSPTTGGPFCGISFSDFFATPTSTIQLTNTIAGTNLPCNGMTFWDDDVLLQQNAINNGNIIFWGLLYRTNR